MTLVLWFLSAWGAAFVIGHSKISLALRVLLGGSPSSIEGPALGYGVEADIPVRVVTHGDGGLPTIVRPAIRPLIPVVGPWLAALLECCACTGFHLGWLAVVLGVVDVPFSPRWVSALGLAFATSGVNLLLAKWVGIA
jgi:hypothetical protein